MFYRSHVLDAPMCLHRNEVVRKVRSVGTKGNIRESRSEGVRSKRITITKWDVNDRIEFVRFEVCIVLSYEGLNLESSS
jgi:hypothetical protein